jgi:zinc/manganese transport system permease protein
VILAFGLGVGVYLLSLYKGFATAATNILFGQIFGVSPGQITLLTAIAVGVLLAMVLLYRPLLFASVDPELAEARGVRTRLVGLLFVYVLALTVTEAAQVVGTLLVLSLAITPAAAATRLSARTPVVIAVSIAFALIAADGGLVLSLIHSDVKASVFISAISFAFYVLARVTAQWILPILTTRGHASRLSGTRGEPLPNAHACDPAPGGAGVTSVATSEREDGVG